MPQMSPLMWMNLFILFSALLLVSSIKIYFSQTPKISLENKTTKMINQNKFNWTW